ncbi:MAG: DUF192 domain-containing protein [Aestuariivita sp.]|nr:DUF192 domain-containing protein [Aestuariivita sp.]
MNKIVIICFIFFSIGTGVKAGVSCNIDRISLRGDWGQANFSVEIADDPQERSLGLMFRDRLPMSVGMLFIFDKPQTVAFWMKNTFISLDMIFFDQKGIVKKIHSMAQPEDLTSISGGKDIRFVLEINGGLANQLGISVGSEMRHPAIEQSKAAWVC